MINVAVSGAAGRMGQTVCATVEGADDMALVEIVRSIMTSTVRWRSPAPSDDTSASSS